jgi:hypothetical protein
MTKDKRAAKGERGAKGKRGATDGQTAAGATDGRTATGPTATPRLRWRDNVAEHDYAAAGAYLSLKLDGPAVREAVARLRRAKLTTRRENDILRAAGLTPARLDDPGVMKDLVKVIEGERLSPVLVIVDEHVADIADGYHRVSLVYRFDPYADVPLKLA